MNLEQLCRKIDLPALITEQVINCRLPSGEEWKRAVRGLSCHETREGSFHTVKAMLAPDDNGIKMLACQLSVAVENYEKYVELGIPEEIYVATMKCFSRFVCEHQVSHGYYAFDRGFWTPRQISLYLFRIGELEYERVVENGRKIIHIHIPSDADMTQEKLKVSYDAAKRFFGQYYPDYAGCDFHCSSWLLSPELPKFLDRSSKIISFQNLFEIYSVYPDNDSYRQWVFKNPKLAIEECPEDTSLQKKIKAHVLSGGKVGAAAGILNPDRFKSNS